MQYSLFGFLSALVLTLNVQAAEPQRRLFTPDDVNALHEVSDPQLSPDGEWVAYYVRTSDLQKDERKTHVWMTNWAGTRTFQVTNSNESEDSPRWSPDGLYLAFLSGRSGDDEPDQLWLMDRAGGEGQAVTSFKGDVVDYAWSPDGKRIVLVVMDEDPAREAEKDKEEVVELSKFVVNQEHDTGYLSKNTLSATRVNLWRPRWNVRRHLLYVRANW